MMSQEEETVRASINMTQSLLSQNPHIKAAGSIYSTGTGSTSAFPSDVVSVICPSELEFQFDDMVLNSQAYRRAFSQAQSRADPRAEERPKSSLEPSDLAESTDNLTIGQNNMALASLPESLRRPEGLSPREILAEAGKQMRQLNQRHNEELMAKDDLIERLRYKLADIAATTVHTEELTVKDDLIQQLRQEVAELAAETTQLTEELTAKDDRIEQLSDLLCERPINIGNQQLPLQMPESVIIQAWKALCYRVQNFVFNYSQYDNPRKVKAWAESRASELTEISPRYGHFDYEKACGRWLIEAALWNALMRLVFSVSTTDGNVLWAGRYAAKISKLSMLSLYL